MSIINGQSIGGFWKRNESRFLIGLAFCLVAFAAFQAGRSYEKVAKNDDVKVYLSPQEQNNDKMEIKALGEALEGMGAGSGKVVENTEQSVDGITSQVEKKCAFVGSKNSNKYHLPNCPYANKIKPENKVCFSSEEEAKNRGYVRAGCCD